MDVMDVVDLLASLLEDHDFAGVAPRGVGPVPRDVLARLVRPSEGLVVKFLDGSEFVLLVSQTRVPRDETTCERCGKPTKLVDLHIAPDEQTTVCASCLRLL